MNIWLIIYLLIGAAVAVATTFSDMRQETETSLEVIGSHVVILLLLAAFWPVFLITQIRKRLGLF